MKKKFIKRILVLLIPVILYYSLPLYVFITSGELYKFKSWTQNNSYLIGNIYRNSFKEYSLKLAEVNSFKKLDFLVLGSSRGLQIRDHFFNKNITFYNASKSASSLGHLRYLVSHISKETKINHVIIFLDQWWFNQNIPLENDFELLHNKYFHESFSDTKDLLVNSSSQTYSDFLIKEKFDLNTLKEENGKIIKIGMNAIYHNEGYRSDGSYRYGRLLEGKVARDVKYNETFERVEKGLHSFTHGKSIGKNQLQELNNLLLLCKKRNINVIGILPPFSPKLNTLLEKNHKNYQYMDNFNKEIKPLFTNKKYSFFDYSNINSLNIENSDEYFLIDPYHGSEIIYANLLLDLTNHIPVLKESININLLKKRLSTSKNLYIFEN